jgi:hypothetical protein
MLPASSGVPAVSSYLDTGEVTITSLLTSILNWLREGYPEGVPGPDRVPLLALLRATPLTEDQIKEVVRNRSGLALVGVQGFVSVQGLVRVQGRGRRRRNGPGPRGIPRVDLDRSCVGFTAWR